MAGEGKKITFKFLKAEIDNLKDKLEEINGLKERVQQLETIVKGFGKEVTIDIHDMVDISKNHKKSRKSVNYVNKKSDIKRQDEQDLDMLKCNMCVKKFTKFCDIEYHIKKNHEKHKEFECVHCKKTFVTKWRLTKHIKMHEKMPKCCHYFNNCDDCPFEELGC